jgi:hypothetical protein
MRPMGTFVVQAFPRTMTRPVDEKQIVRRQPNRWTTGNWPDANRQVGGGQSRRQPGNRMLEWNRWHRGSRSTTSPADRHRDGGVSLAAAMRRCCVKRCNQCPAWNLTENPKCQMAQEGSLFRAAKSCKFAGSRGFSHHVLDPPKQTTKNDPINILP